MITGLVPVLLLRQLPLDSDDLRAPWLRSSQGTVIVDRSRLSISWLVNVEEK